MTLKIFLPFVTLILGGTRGMGQVPDSVPYEKITLDTPRYNSPVETSKTVDVSNNFNIIVSDTGLSVVYKEQIFPFHSIAGLDNYFNKHVKVLSKTPIVVKGPADLKDGVFLDVIGLLKKYKLYHFSIVATKP